VRRATRRVWPILVVAVLALPAAACSREPAAPPTHRLEGTYIVHGFFPRRDFGAPCKGGDAGYPDLRQGTTVTVKDGTGATLGTSALQGGTLQRGKLRGRDDDCAFSFSLTVPEREAYRIEVGRRGSVRFTGADLQRTNWKADLTIGQYTMFDGI
jgi:hypothetical protein